ncbi:MAG TPA: hypothetical protein VIJ87_10390 [Pyrinomonadaceae bacterium]
MATVLVRADHDYNSVSKIINLVDPTGAQDAATKAYVDTLVEGLAWKDSVRVKAPSNVTISSPGATIDGITMTTGDRMLLNNQTTTTENGIYVWNGAATPATRAADASTSSELEQAVTTVEEGTSANTTWRQQTVNFVLGTGSPSFVAFGTAASAASETVAGIAEIATQAETDAGTDDARMVTPLKLKTSPFVHKGFASSFGDGSATSYVITHNLNSLDVSVYVYENGGSKRQVVCEVQHTSVNSVTLLFSSSVASNALRALVTKVA